MTAIKSFALTPGGLAVAVLTDNRLVEQIPRRGNTSGVYSTDWASLSTDGLTGRVVALHARYDNRLLALTATGQLFEQHREQSDPPGKFRWRQVEPPAEAA